MTKRNAPNVRIIDLVPGLWIWRLEHPGWREDADWQEVVTCICVDAGSERWLLDPLLPPENATQFWDRLTDRPPTAVAILSPDHMRETWSDRKTWSLDALVRRYGCRAFGPGAFDVIYCLPAAVGLQFRSQTNYHSSVAVRGDG